MTQTTALRREDARDLQARLYREIGISAVAAALRSATQADPAPRAGNGAGVDQADAEPQAAKTGVARAA